MKPKIAKFKVCSACQKNLPLSRFYKSKTGSQGTRSICIPCYKDRYTSLKKLRNHQENLVTVVSNAVEPEAKTCSQCNQSRPLEFFHKNTSGADGAVKYKAYCKFCARKYSTNQANKRKQDKLRVASNPPVLQERPVNISLPKGNAEHTCQVCHVSLVPVENWYVSNVLEKREICKRCQDALDQERKERLEMLGSLPEDALDAVVHCIVPRTKKLPDHLL